MVAAWIPCQARNDKTTHIFKRHLVLGGIAKEYIVNQVINVLAHAGVDPALANLGGDVGQTH